MSGFSRRQRKYLSFFGSLIPSSLGKYRPACACWNFVSWKKRRRNRPGDTDTRQLFQKSFQIWQSENARLEQIVLRFSGGAAQLVRERNWHSSQQIQELADGNLELSLTLNSLEEIVPEFFSGGKIVKLLAR